jgi:hypothetical protein
MKTDSKLSVDSKKRFETTTGVVSISVHPLLHANYTSHFQSQVVCAVVCVIYRSDLSVTTVSDSSMSAMSGFIVKDGRLPNLDSQDDRRSLEILPPGSQD